jgi:DNA-directed RNA polymerase subunit RPC12/RpoP
MSESTVPPPMPGAPIRPATSAAPIPAAARIPAQTPGAGSRPLTYACAGCGARVEFAPGTGALRCPYCQHEEAVVPAARTIREHPFDELARRPRTALASHVWACQKCGATTDSDLLASRCQFCGAPLVDAGDANEQIAPEAVLPFEVDRAGVRSALRLWVASRRFAPRSFRSVSEAESLSGTYVPHWTFDADTTSDYVGQRGDHYWETETYTTTVDGQTQTQTRQVMRTRWSHATGRVARAFDDVMVRGTARLIEEHQDKLEPWPLNATVAYQPEYLSGYSALRYDVEPENGLAVAKEQMGKVIERDCRNDIGGDEQRLSNVSTSYADVMYKLVLLPVWVVAYLYGGKTWQVLVNGRTGEVIGSRPYSKVKIVAAVLSALIVIAAVIVAIVVAHRGG